MTSYFTNNASVTNHQSHAKFRLQLGTATTDPRVNARYTQLSLTNQAFSGRASGVGCLANPRVTAREREEWVRRIASLAEWGTRLLSFRKSIHPQAVGASSSTDNSSDEGGDKKDEGGDEAHGCRKLEWSMGPVMYSLEMDTPTNQILIMSTTSAALACQLYVHFPTVNQINL
ncbi:hypothetical protein EDD15DRAFT_2257335 [Pisolithus albus]|nr:hypothetical protein EDD15DRAFT_2257335 [Pisolithus albus]